MEKLDYIDFFFNPILHGGVQRTPPLQFFDRGSSGDGSNELIFLDFVPFNNQQDLAKPFFRFFFQIFEKFCLEDTWSPKILTRNSQKSKKNPIFPEKSYFFFLNLNSTCSQLIQTNIACSLSEPVLAVFKRFSQQCPCEEKKFLLGYCITKYKTILLSKSRSQNDTRTYREGRFPSKNLLTF